MVMLLGCYVSVENKRKCMMQPLKIDIIFWVVLLLNFKIFSSCRQTKSHHTHGHGYTTKAEVGRCTWC